MCPMSPFLGKEPIKLIFVFFPPLIQYTVGSDSTKNTGTHFHAGKWLQHCLQTSLLFPAIEKDLLTPCCGDHHVVCVGPQPLLTPANLFLAKHTLETFEMKPIAEEEEEEEKVEVIKVPVVKPKSVELVQPRSGTAAVVFGGSGSCADAAG